MMINLFFLAAFLLGSFLLSRVTALAEARRLQAIRIRNICAEIQVRDRRR